MPDSSLIEVAKEYLDTAFKYHRTTDHKAALRYANVLQDNANILPDSAVKLLLAVAALCQKGLPRDPDNPESAPLTLAEATEAACHCLPNNGIGLQADLRRYVNTTDPVY